MLLPILLACSVAFAVAVAWIVLRASAEQPRQAETLEPVRRMIECMQRESDPAFDPRQFELDLG